MGKMKEEKKVCKEKFKPSFEEKYKKMRVISWALASVLAVVIGLFAYSLYFNWNYWVFKVLIAGNYIYTDTLDEIYKEQINVETQNYFNNFDDVVISIVSNKISSTGEDHYTYLYTPPQYIASEEATEAKAKEAEIKEMNANTVYLRIPNVSEQTKDFVIENKERLNQYKNLIIDLQDNYGGDLNSLYDIADLFLPKGAIIATEQAKSRLFTRTIKSKHAQYFNFDKIVFLQNGGTASASECFINALKENLSNVSTVGSVSFGKGIGQVTLKVKSGYAIKATVIQVLTPNGNSIHKTGVIPDVSYTADDSDSGYQTAEFACTHFELN